MNSRAADPSEICLERRLDLADRLDGAAATDALVLENRVAVLVLDGDDLVVVCAGILCSSGFLMRSERELIEVGAAEAPLLGDHLGAHALVRRLGVARAEGLRVGVPTIGERGTHRGA
jgi:hypothetical protein